MILNGVMLVFIIESDQNINCFLINENSVAYGAK